jgi:hypothetical protein
MIVVDIVGTFLTCECMIKFFLYIHFLLNWLKMENVVIPSVSEQLPHALVRVLGKSEPIKRYQYMYPTQ